jgi:hypothetical protein
MIKNKDIKFGATFNCYVKVAVCCGKLKVGDTNNNLFTINRKIER